MEVILTAIMGEIANRSISFLFDKYSNPTSPAIVEGERLHDLQRLLLRVRVIVEEAEERHVTNHAMLHLLSIARKEMYRGYYTLDTFRYRRDEQDKAKAKAKAKDHKVSNSFAMSEFNPAKRLFLSTGDRGSEKEVQQVLANLSSIIVDASELIAFLKNYPPVYRQPYSMHLLLDKCMFGRQMEMERIMNFLMQTHTGASAETIGVLPIIGPIAVGKSTLVSHVCSNERVRSLFSRILLVSEDDLNDPRLDCLNDGRVIKHQNNAYSGDEPLLVIVELPKDVDDAAWKRLYSTYAGCVASGSKIIITSRSSKIIDFGTTQALALNYLPREAFWYYFKVLTFGSVDPDEQPRLASIAMKIVTGMKGTFISANLIASLLRANLNAQFWSEFYKFSRLFVQNNISMFGEHPGDLLRKNKPTMFQRMSNGDCCVVHNQYQTSFDHEEVPKITFQDVLSGSVKCRGKIEVLAWKSQIPPYKNNIFSCEIKKLRRMAIR